MKYLLFLLPALMLSLTPSAQADTNWLGSLMSSVSTTGSIYLTTKDKKLIIATQDDASSFVGSGGAIHGPFLTAALLELRAANPELDASDMQLAQAILARNAVPHL